MNDSALPTAEALAQRLSALATLGQRLAHDFDNILTGVIGFAELALAEVPKSSAANRYLAEILQVSEHGIALTQRLHLFQRSGTVHLGPTDPARVIHEAVARLGAELPGSITISAPLTTKLPLVQIDAAPLHTALEQLLNNALDSCQTAGAIQIDALPITIEQPDLVNWLGGIRPGPHVEIAVTDSGSGISAEVRSKLIVEPFFTTKPKHRGLGLPIAFRILTAHQAGLSFSALDATGCTVRMAVPIATSEGKSEW